MKIVLREAVTKLGEPGEVVDVADGYARNYLIPKGMALQATKGNLKQIDQQIDTLKERAAEQKEAAELEAKQIGELVLRMERKVADAEDATLYGSVSVADIGDALEERGFDVDRGNIELESPIKRLGDYDIEMTLAYGVRAAVTVQVRDEEGLVQPPDAEAEEIEEMDTSDSAEAAAAPVQPGELEGPEAHVEAERGFVEEEDETLEKKEEEESEES